jgi:cob(I)alamin adenosyltransferase
LLGKDRVPKYDVRLEAVGQLDELQAVLGLCRAGPASQRSRQLLAHIEHDLYRLMSELAAGPETRLPEDGIRAEQVAWLERATDELGRQLPVLKDFVLPGDSQAGAGLNLARTVARRAERAVAWLMHNQEGGSDQVLPYLNRLSSLLFALACYEDVQAGMARPTLAREAGRD